MLLNAIAAKEKAIKDEEKTEVNQLQKMSENVVDNTKDMSNNIKLKVQEFSKQDGEDGKNTDIDDASKD